MKRIGCRSFLQAPYRFASHKRERPRKEMIRIYRTPQQGAHEHTPAQHYKREDVLNHPIMVYLRPEQVAYLSCFLRVLKRKYQEDLCIALMDYMETGIPCIPEDITIGALFMLLTRVGLQGNDNPNDKRIIRPLNN